MRNRQIEARNDSRLDAADLLSTSAAPQLVDKLRSARAAAAGQQQVLRQADMVFRTDKEMLGEQDLAEWDRQLDSRSSMPAAKANRGGGG